MNITFDTAEFKQALQAKREQITAAARPAAQAAAQVIYDQARANVNVSKKGHWFHGTSFRKTGQKYWFEPGTLRNSIYQVYSKDNSSETKSTYHISWNYREAPYGFMVEMKKPFIGPAVHDRMDEALQAMKTTYIERVNNGI